jgi:hypothetical protein
MPTVKGTNVTKYDAGGSGDNVISDGYIKSVEKVWIDTYTYSSAKTIGAGLVIEIAVLPEGKKVTGVDVNVIGLSATTTDTLTIGTKLAAGTTNNTLFLAATRCGGTVGADLPAGSEGVSWIKANAQVLPYELTGGTNRIFVAFAASATVTVGTITSIVRYT